MKIENKKWGLILQSRHVAFSCKPKGKRRKRKKNEKKKKLRNIQEEEDGNVKEIDGKKSTRKKAKRKRLLKI